MKDVNTMSPKEQEELMMRLATENPEDEFPDVVLVMGPLSENGQLSPLASTIMDQMLIWGVSSVSQYNVNDETPEEADVGEFDHLQIMTPASMFNGIVDGVIFFGAWMKDPLCAATYFLARYRNMNIWQFCSSGEGTDDGMYMKLEHDDVLKGMLEDEECIFC